MVGLVYAIIAGAERTKERASVCVGAGLVRGPRARQSFLKFAPRPRLMVAPKHAPLAQLSSRPIQGFNGRGSWTTRVYRYPPSHGINRTYRRNWTGMGS